MSFLEKIHASPGILKIYSNEEIESDAKLRWYEIKQIIGYVKL